jgi:Uma2 family endonuclease
MATRLERPSLSREEFRALQDTDEEYVRGYEYEDGRLVPVPPVHGPQSRAWMDLSGRLNHHVETHQLGEVFLDMAVYLDPEGRRRLFPDIVYLATDRLHQYDDEVIVGPPTLVVEVSAVSSRERDRDAKMRAYHEAGVPWYWIADVVERQTEEYRWSEEGYQLVSRTPFEENFSPLLFPGLTIPQIR